MLLKNIDPLPSLSIGSRTLFDDGSHAREHRENNNRRKTRWVLLYGDTNSTLAGALEASKLQVKVAHVEAGLCSHNMRMPEEQSRILTDRVSSVLFCPTVTAVRNMHSDGYKNIDAQIVNAGDVMFDAALYYGNRARIHVWLD